VVLAGNHQMILAALRSLLAKERAIEMVGDAADATHCLKWQAA
jgi:hypothetical protein